MREFKIEDYFIRLTRNKDLVRCVIARDESIEDVVDTFMLPNAKIDDENIVERVKLYIDDVL